MSLRSRLPVAIKRPVRRALERATEVVRAGSQPLWTVRLLASGNVRRAEVRPWRRLLLAALGAAAVVVAVAVTISLTGSWWAALALLPFVLSALRAAWARRRRRGRDAGLPDGRIRRGPIWLLDPDWFAADARRYGKVFKTNFYDTPTVCVTDLAAGRALLRDEAASLGPPWGHYERFVPGGSVRGTVGARHRELRRVFATALGPDAVRAWAPALARHARAGMEDLVVASADGPVNPREPVRTAVFRAWTEVMLGVDPATWTGPDLRTFVDRLDPDRRYYATPITDAEMEADLDRLGALVVAGARAEGAADTLARRFDDGEAGGLDDPAILRNLLLSTITTRDDVAGLLVWVLWYLAADHQVAASVAQSGEEGEDTTRFVSEVLRLAQSEFVMRRVTEPIDHIGPLGRVFVPDDWFVRVCIHEIHRDPAVFPDPARCDPGRFADEQLARGRSTFYAPFGIDHRACLGELLTRTFAEQFAAAAACYRLDTVTDGPAEMSHQRHWAPSTRWTLRVSRHDVGRRA